METTISSARPGTRCALRRRLVRGIAALAALGACGGADTSFTIGGHEYHTADLVQWALPRDLQEVSGLTLGGDGRLFAHNDEQAVIFELDFTSGRAVNRFTLGNPALTGDFEGIAAVDNRLFLVTSDGDLFAAQIPAEGGYADYELHRTGLGQRCEIEGLDYDARRRLLLMACKTAREKSLRGHIAVLAWSLDQAAPAPEHDLIVPWKNASGKSRPPSLSGVTRSPSNGNLVLVAARQRVLLELAPDGALVQAVRLPDEQAHPQMEGVAMTASGDLIIADEGPRRRGRLSVYRARP